MDIAPNGRSGRRRLKILVIASEAPPIVSGVSRCVDKLTTGLRDRGQEVDVISAVDIPRFTVGEYRFSSFLAHWPRIAARLSEYDVINLHGPVPTMSDAFLMLAPGRSRQRRPRLVYTHHSAIEIRGLTAACRAYDKLHRALTRKADLTIATSQHYADYHTRPGRPSPRIIPWGVGATPLYPAKTSEIGRLRVLFVGQMREYKGVDTLLRAVAGVPQVELTLIGAGPLLGRYQQLANDLDGRNVRFHGRVSDFRLQQEYERNDVIVLPSVTRAEAFGLVTLEGMMGGCVPVVSDLPGVRDLAVTTGLVVPPRDEHRLRIALLELAADHGRLRGMQAASRTYAEGLSWESVVADYHTSFGGLVFGQRAGDRLLSPVHPIRRPDAEPVGASGGAATMVGGARYTDAVGPDLFDTADLWG
jgi:glycosyltransferase involved in cell wall biosynthesis